jgi:hypothetical protein
MTASPPVTAPPPAAYAPAPVRRHRPFGVTILAIIDILIGIFIIISSIGVLALAGYLTSITMPSEIEQNLPQWFIDMAPTALALAGVVLLAIGLVSMLIAWGFLKGRNWSRTLAIVLLFLSIMAAVFNAIVSAILTTDVFFGLILSIIIPVLLIWYLTTPKVKAWFIPGYYVRQP